MRDAAACVSLANLCFLQAWAALCDSRQLYFRKVPPDYGDLFALVLDVLLLGAAFWVCLRLTRRLNTGLGAMAARCGFCVVLLLPARNIRLQIRGIESLSIHRALGHAGALAVLAVTVVVVALWNRRIARAAGAALVIFAPLVPVNMVCGTLAIRSARQEIAGREARVAAPGGHRPERRVVVLVFDELDYRLAFEQRPPAIALPELDRLRAESVFALHAYPAQRETLLSIPAIITGRSVSAASHPHAGELNVESDSAAFHWSEIPNMFSEARAMGVRTALAGWYHPYCRILGTELDDCHWEAAGSVEDRVEYGHRLPSSAMMLLEAQRQLARAPYLHLYQDGQIGRPEHAREYLGIHRQAVRLATDASFGLVFLHYPIPHLPGVFNVKTHALDPDHPHQYVDNLPLVDVALGELRSAMERAGVWNSTDVILTSDHPLRFDVWPAEADFLGGKGSPLVPLMIKLAGAREGVTYAPALDNRVVHDLALALLRRQFATPRNLTSWLDRHPLIEPAARAAGR